MKITTFKNGAYVTFEKNLISGFYTVTAKTESGQILDKVSADSYRGALEYRRSFSLIAKAQK